MPAPGKTGSEYKQSDQEREGLDNPEASGRYIRLILQVRHPHITDSEWGLRALHKTR